MREGIREDEETRGKEDCAIVQGGGKLIQGGGIFLRGRMIRGGEGNGGDSGGGGGLCHGHSGTSGFPCGIRTLSRDTD